MFRLLVRQRISNALFRIQKTAFVFKRRKERIHLAKMGAAASGMNPRHINIWNNLNTMESAQSRLQMLNMLLEAPEYVESAKRAGIYADLLRWMAAARSGQRAAWPAPFVGAAGVASAAVAATPTFAPPRVNPTALPPAPTPTRMPDKHAPLAHAQQGAPALRIFPEDTRPTVGNTGRGAGASAALTTIPPPKRALDVLHESYAILGLDDSKPLTHEALRAAYRKAAVKVHPDKGGSQRDFEAVNKAFTYVEELLNKLLPKNVKEEDRLSMPVNPETALRMRATTLTPLPQAAPAPVPQLPDVPPVSLNPKKLDMAMFNKLFEENKLANPDEEGYGDWLKSNDGRADGQVSLGTKIGASDFNAAFAEHARRVAGKADAGYAAPAELYMSPGFGTELGSDRPSHFIKGTGGLDGAGLAYTDLKFAYGEGATFSQDVGDVDILKLDKSAPLPGRARTMDEAERMYKEAPAAMTSEQAAAVRAYEAQRAAMEAQRFQRVATRDSEAEQAHMRLKSRIHIKE